VDKNIGHADKQLSKQDKFGTRVVKELAYSLSTYELFLYNPSFLKVYA
jgi:hypothetical protein